MLDVCICSRSLRKDVLLTVANSLDALLPEGPCFCHYHHLKCLFLLVCLSYKSYSLPFTFTYFYPFPSGLCLEGHSLSKASCSAAPRFATCFLLSVCRSIPTDVVQFITLDF